MKSPNITNKTNKETEIQGKSIESFNFIKIVSVLLVILAFSIALTTASTFYQKNKITGNITFGTTESVGTFERVSLGFPFSYIEEERKIDEKEARVRYEALLLNLIFYFVVTSSAVYSVKEGVELFKKQQNVEQKNK
jgi:hypothetical protein